MTDAPEAPAKTRSPGALRRRWFTAAALASLAGASLGWFFWQRTSAGHVAGDPLLKLACAADAGTLKPWEQFNVPAGKDSPVELCRCVKADCCTCYELPGHRFQRGVGIKAESAAFR